MTKKTLTQKCISEECGLRITLLCIKRKKIDKSDLYVEVEGLYPIETGSSEATVSRNAIYEDKVRKLGSKERYQQAVESAYKYLGYN